MTVGTGWPLLGRTDTAKSTPASAELVPVLLVLFFDTVTSVKRPTTAEGLITNTLPLPLLVFIPVVTLPMQVQGVLGLPFASTPPQTPVPVGEKAILLAHCCPPVMVPVLLLFSTHAVCPLP